MQTKRTWLIAIALLGIFLVNEYQSRRAQDAQLTAMRSELARLREQQARLAAQAARPPIAVRTQITAPPETAVAAAPTPAPASPAPGDEPADRSRSSAQRWEEEVQAHQAAVEGAFAAEPTDGAWAIPTRLALRDHLISLARLSSSSVESIDCRSSICRVEVVHRSTDAARQFTESAFTAPEDRAWNGPVFLPLAQTNLDGSLAAIMYLGREGTALLPPAR